MIYLASPYTDPNPAVREFRAREACRITAALIRAGRVIYSPIVSSHPLVEYGMPTDWEFWKRFDRDIIRRCDSMIVLMLDGWDKSVGVNAEIEIAEACGLAVSYAHPTALVAELHGTTTANAGHDSCLCADCTTWISAVKTATTPTFHD